MKRTYILLLPAFFIISSCKKFLDIPFPQDQVSSVSAFSDDSTAQAAVTGLYTQLMSGAAIFLNGPLTIYPGLSSDELFNTSPNAAYDQFYANALSPEENTQIYNGLWKWAYTDIFHANNILEGLERSTNVSEILKRRLKGEALAVRALCYFYLTNLYGDVPLQTSTNYELNGQMARTPGTAVYQQLIDDLKNAKELLALSYPAPGRTRFNRSAAEALLARVYLYNKDYVLSAETASEVINESSVYSLQTDLNNVFLLGSNEALLQLYPVSINQNAGDGFTLIPSASASLRPPLALTNGLLNAFEQSDKRRVQWINSKTVAGETFFYPFKYKVKSGSIISEGNMILRLAEQYLIRSEARAMADDLDGALEDLNIIRVRAGLPMLNGLTKDELLQAISRERRVELMTEMGHRWFDLKRTGKVNEVLLPLKPGWQSSDALYPLPQRDIDRNPFLKQNPGY